MLFLFITILLCGNLVVCVIFKHKNSYLVSYNVPEQYSRYDKNQKIFWNLNGSSNFVERQINV